TAWENFNKLGTPTKTNDQNCVLTTLSLDELRGKTIHLAFEFTGGEAALQDWVIDRITVKEVISGAGFRGDKTLAMGKAYKYSETLTFEQAYTITNMGEEPLIISDFEGAEGVTTDTDELPLEVSVGNSERLIVTMTKNSADLEFGLYNSNFTLTTNDPANPTVTVGITAEIDAMPENIGDIAIGEGEELNNAPFDYSTIYGLTQSIYTANEVAANGGVLKGVVYKSQAEQGFTSKVKVWLTETDRSDYAIRTEINYGDSAVEAPSSSFITEGLIQVFDGEIQIPKGGGDAIIIFDEPYDYKGGNLVVHAWRNEHDGGGARFLSTTTTENRTIRKYPIGGVFDPIEEANTATRYDFPYLPNANFLIGLEDLGSLAGTVKDEEGVAMKDVTLKLVEGNISRTTDAEGKYTFPYLTAGTHEIEVSKFGYYTQTVEVTITDGGEIVEDVTMELLPLTTVSGKVTGSNTEETGLAKVKITFEGYENYTATTDAEGIYTIEDVYADKSYDVTAELFGYKKTITTAELGTEATSTHDIHMMEEAYPVNSAKAYVVGANAQVDWKVPAMGTSFRYDADTFIGNNGLGSYYGVMGMVQRVPAQLTSMSFYINEFEQHAGLGPKEVNVFVFDLNSNGLPTGKILFSQDDVPVTAVRAWTTFTFPEVVEAPNGFFVAISRTEGHMMLGQGPATAEWPEVSNTYYYGDFNIEQFAALNDSARPHFGIRAEGLMLEESLSIASNSMTRSAVDPSVARAAGETDLNVVNYALYRFEEGAERAEWTTLSEELKTLNYTDEAWSTLEDGTTYQYAIVAEYNEDNFSLPVLTNTLTKGMEVDFTVNVTTNIDEDAVDAVVTLTSASNDPTRIYTGKVDATGAAKFLTVWKGIYSVSVTKPGYNEYIGKAEVDEAGQAHAAVLDQTIVAPYELDVTVDGKNATFTWNNAPEQFFDNMENHTDWAISNIGEYTLVDLDGAKCYSWNQASYPNEQAEQAFIVFNNASQALALSVPPPAAHSDNKFLVSMAANGPVTNDWLILPRIKVTAATHFEFYAKSLPNEEYGDEPFRVLISTTGTNAPDDFELIETEAAPQNAWTKFSYDLSDYEGENVYLAINHVSDNGFMLMIDDIMVGEIGAAEGASISSHAVGDHTYTVSLNETEVATEVAVAEYVFENLEDGQYTAGVQSDYASGSSDVVTKVFNIGTSGVTLTEEQRFKVYPNPVIDVLNIETDQTITEIVVLDYSGRTVKVMKGNHRKIDLQSLSAGHYVVRIHTATAITPVKIVKQ
ncbi:MAG: carboxypeptidase regulatory-like domain-containing protein, partial [Bacteroidales bacterium]|nr:carboxypeptidase regulatory-like domain-containing protein [Bacteroidales bacterium]